MRLLIQSLLVLCLVIDIIAVQEWKTTISSSTQSSFNFFWDKCVGSGHGSLALREDYQQQLKVVHDYFNVSSVRFHGILDDDVGSVNGINDYSFINIDNIYDYMISINMKPYVEISYMPDAFASGSATAHHYKGNITPPKDYTIWYQFIQTWMKHLVDRYGINEVSTWKIEVWNEPNCGDFVSHGGCNCNYTHFDDYMSLYSNTSRAIKSVSDKLNVGGPATAQLCWIDRFLNYTLSQSIPIDFVSTHLYPTATFIDTSEGVNAFYNALKTAGTVLNKYNNNGNKFKLYLSEYNSGLSYGRKLNYSNHDNNYAAAFMIFNALKLQPLITEYNYAWLSYWAFSDIFEEQGFDSAPFNNDFGMQTIRGIVKPVLRSLQLLYELGSEISFNTTRLDKNNDDGTVAVYTLKNKNENNRVAIYIANWNLYQQPINDQEISIQIQNNNVNNVPKSGTLYKIDANNVNPMNEWINMGEPTYPTAQQLQAINESSQFVTQSVTFSKINSNTVQFNTTVTKYGVLVIDIQY